MKQLIFLPFCFYLNSALAQMEEHNSTDEGSSHEFITATFDAHAFSLMIHQLPQMSEDERHNVVTRLCRNEEFAKLLAENFDVPMLLTVGLENHKQNLIDFLNLIAESGERGSLNLLREMYLNYDMTSVVFSYEAVNQESVILGKNFRREMKQIAERAIKKAKKPNLYQEAKLFEWSLSLPKMKCEISLINRWLKRMF